MRGDLFIDPSPHEDAYAEALRAHVESVDRSFIERGIIPPWIDAETVLSKDEHRLLKLIDDSAGYRMYDGDMVTVPYEGYGARQVPKVVVDMGMNATANLNAVINKCLERGLVVSTWENDLRATRLDMTARGRYYLEVKEQDAWYDGGEE